MIKLIIGFCITLCVYIMPSNAQSYNYLRTISEKGTDPNQLENPLEMVISKDTIYVNDGSKIKKFDTTGAYIGEWETFDKFGNTIAGYTINVNSVGHLLFLARNEILEYTTQGELIKTISMTDVFGFDNSFVGSIAPDKKGNIYAADMLKGRVYKISETGGILKKWQYDSDTTTINSRKSARIFINKSENIYLKLSNQSLIQKYDTTGNLLITWVDTAKYNGRVLAFGKNGTLFIQRSNSIELLDSNFQFITTVARTGINEGQYYGANGMAVDSRGNFYVVNRALETNILVFAYSETPTGIEDEIINVSISSIYPNPFQDVLEVNVQGKGEATLELTDLTGHVVSSSPYYFNPVQLNTSQLQKGLYLCRIIQNGKQVFVTKVQK